MFYYLSGTVAHVEPYLAVIDCGGVGYGGADKRQVMLMTQRLLGMKEIPRPDDAADALAIAICHGRAATSLLNTEREFDPNRYDTR